MLTARRVPGAAMRCRVSGVGERCWLGTDSGLATTAARKLVGGGGQRVAAGNRVSTTAKRGYCGWRRGGRAAAVPGAQLHVQQWVRHSARRVSLHSVGVPGTRPTGTRGWLRYILFFAPSHLAAGVALGGLVATMGATCWYLHTTGRVNLWEQVDKMDKLVIVNPDDHTGPAPPFNRARWPGYEHIVETPRRGAQTQPKKFEIPLPLMMALLGWTASLLWTTARTAYRSRIDLELRTFFHDVTFTLLTQRKGRLAQRRLISRGLKSTLFCNEYLTATVRNACANVCVTDPVVRMPARHAPLVVQALQGPISEVSAAEHLHGELGQYKEVKHWYALTCSSSSFRTVIITDELAQSLMHENVDRCGNYEVPMERVLHLPKNGRRKDPAVRSLVAAIQEVQAREALFDEKNILPFETHVPLVGWLNIPIPLTDTIGDDGGGDGDGDGDPSVEAAVLHATGQVGKTEQQAWVDAFDTWEDETAAAVGRSMRSSNHAGSIVTV